MVLLWVIGLVIFSSLSVAAVFVITAKWEERNIMNGYLKRHDYIKNLILEVMKDLKDQGYTLRRIKNKPIKKDK